MFFNKRPIILFSILMVSTLFPINTYEHFKLSDVDEQIYFNLKSKMNVYISCVTSPCSDTLGCVTQVIELDKESKL